MLLGGSKWRRWDLHTHTPGTLLNDQYGDWEEFLYAVEAEQQVKVIGVTDYASITNYSKLKELKSQGRIANIDLILPNIEFRIAPPTNKATAVNIHVLVSPDDPNHEQEILNALARLSWQYDGQNYSCVPDQLRKLGRAVEPKITDDSAALTMGVEQFKPDFTTLREWFNNERWLRQNSLVGVAAGDDGLSGLRRDGGWAALRDEITRFSNFLFSGRPGERDFWIRPGSEEDRQTVLRLGGPKPCVHGSDAHKIDRLFRQDQDRFCWIKADTTFDGLKQILYEPADRVHIGPTPPLYHDEARVIQSVRLANANGWFEELKLPLNSGLVSIIGQKGSGKSALAELIAYAAGSWNTDELGSFIRRAGEHLNGLTVELTWADDRKSTVEFGGDQSDAKDVRYLSQRFVERLCAEDQIGNELVHEIEAVIFSYINPTDTLDASSFEELRARLTEGIRNEGDRLREEIFRLIREECALRDARGKLPEKKARIKMLSEERAGLTKQMPKPASAEEAKVQQDLLSRRTELAAKQQAVAISKQKLQKISDLRMRVAAFTEQMRRLAAELDPLLKDVGIPNADWAAFHPSFPGDTEAPLARRETELRKAISEAEGAVENPAEGTIHWIQQQIQILTGKESADKARQDKVKSIQSRLSAIKTETARIEAEIAKIEGPDQERLTAAASERLEAYAAYFTNLKLEQTKLEGLYAPLTKKLAADSSAEQEQDLEFSIRWEANLPQWLERGAALFDQRTTIPYGTTGGLASAAEKILKPAWSSGNPEQIKAAHDTFMKEFRKSDLPRVKYLRTGVTLQDMLQWLYEVDHLKLSYGLKYKGVELEKLSPGTKGIVLLILYLGMDIEDTRPLIVDQPDENLDNESIYKLLTVYFKAAKKRRQVVLITHNPNLVVNGDSEQVIIATATIEASGFPRITYSSGSLENNSLDGSGIRGRVCQILEGGSDAFLKREKRYALAD